MSERRTEPVLTLTDTLDPADVAVITDGLRAYDLSQTGYYDFRPLAVFVRDPQTGKVVGGLYGRSEFGMVYVDWLFCPKFSVAGESAAGYWSWRRKRHGGEVVRASR